MNLLDQLDRAVAAGSLPDTPVFVFDADHCKSEEDFEAIIPGIGTVHHTPVVGHWVDGQLHDKAVGFEGRQIVARLCGIDETVLHQRVTAES